MKTRTDLAFRVLANLGLVAEGQPTSASDLARADAAIDPVLRDLAARNILYVGDFDNFDDAPFNYLAIIIASRVAGEFGTTAEQQAATTGMTPGDAEHFLQAQQIEDDSGVPIRACYF